MLSQASLVTHTELLQHPTRSGIAREMMGVDTVQSELLETKANHFPARFGAIALPPKRNTNPVTHFGRRMHRVELQADGSAELLGVANYVCKNSRLLLFPLGPECGNPLLSHAVLIRMGNQQRGVGDLPSPSQTLHLGCIVQSE